ncbi:MAG: hypothetical protein FWF05_02265 [Oscillospiraceae bacterium]|nr:hypothetical protein [Oscillospiraceae bacterium]
MVKSDGTCLPVTLSCILLITTVFVLDYLIFVSEGALRWDFKRLMLESPSGPVAQALALKRSAILSGQVGRIVTSMLIHGGALAHLAPNCLAVLFLKRRAHMLEQSSSLQRIYLLICVFANVFADKYTLVEHGGGFIAGVVLGFFLEPVTSKIY